MCHTSQRKLLQPKEICRKCERFLDKMKGLEINKYVGKINTRPASQTSKGSSIKEVIAVATEGRTNERI